MKKKSTVQSHDKFSNPRKGHIKPQYMDPKSFKSYKQKVSQDFFHHTQAIEGKEFFKKYYGKKVLFLSDNRRAVFSAINSSKLFRSINVFSRLFSPNYFKALGNMVIMGDTFNLKEKQRRKIIQRSKGKIMVTLDLWRNPEFVKDLYGLRGFKALELSWPHDKLYGFRPRILKEFSQLEKIRFRFGGFYHNQEETIFLTEPTMMETFDFLLKMIKNSKTLKVFQCDLSPFYVEPKFLRKLLLYLDNYNVDSWYIKAKIPFEEFFKITQTNSRLKEFKKEEAHDFQQVLATVDLLGLTNFENLDQDLVKICEREGQYQHSPQLLSKMPSMLCKHNRILDINECRFQSCSVKRSKNPMNLGVLLEKFESLRGLYIQITQGDLMLESVDKIDSLSHLRNVIFSEINYILLGNNEEEKYPIADSFLEVLSKSSWKLKRMQLYSDSFEIMGELEFGFLVRRYMPIFDEYLQTFSRLRELEINIDDIFPNGFEKVVQRLEIFRVNFCEFPNIERKWPNDLQIAPFVGNHLKELHFTIKPKYNEMNWIEKFAWNVDRFPDLEVFTVDDQSENKIKLEHFCKFMKAVNKFKNLKRLIIKMKLEKSRNEDYSELLSQDVNKTIRLLEDQMIESIIKDTRTLIDSHPDLEEIDIKRFAGHRIKGIFYQRTERKEKFVKKNLFGGGFT